MKTKSLFVTHHSLFYFAKQPKMTNAKRLSRWKKAGRDSEMQADNAQCAQMGFIN